jgi:hypothetical protein
MDFLLRWWVEWKVEYVSNSSGTRIAVDLFENFRFLLQMSCKIAIEQRWLQVKSE